MNPRKVIERIVVGTVQPITDVLIRAHVHPNLLTTVGFLVTVSSGAAFYTNHIRTAGVLILIGGIFDVFDGKVARATGLVSQFGSFYDSTLDRFSEIAVYVGILTLYNHYEPVTGDLVAIYAVILAMAGSLMVSYTRARAEALGIDCAVGLMQRGERVALIGVASLFFGGSNDAIALSVVIIILAVLTNVTAIQRVIWVYQRSRPTGNIETEDRGEGPVQSSPRAELIVGTQEEKSEL